MFLMTINDINQTALFWYLHVKAHNQIDKAFYLSVESFITNTQDASSNRPTSIRRVQG
jgi:hypothetical protein